MPMVKRCCCSRNLRLGSIVCGIWTLIWCVTSLSLNIIELNDMYLDPEDYIRKMYEDNPTAPIVLIWVNLCVSFLTFLSSIIVIAGILKDNAKMLIPWMIMVLVLVALDAASIIFNIVLAGFTRLFIVFLLLWIITTLINIYCELCVLSHFQELKAGRGRPEDYNASSGSVRYVPAVQHVHIGDVPMNCIQSAHTVYSFHSQNLYDDENAGGTPSASKQNNQMPTALSNGRVFELRPVTSLPSDMHTKYSGNSYTGSIEMKIVDSMPVIVDKNAMYNATNYYTDGTDAAAQSGGGAIPKRPNRFRTVSESAVRQPMINEDSTHASTNSLKNPNDSASTSINGSAAAHNKSSSDKPREGGRASFHVGLSNKDKDLELSPLSDHAEEDEQSL